MRHSIVVAAVVLGLGLLAGCRKEQPAAPAAPAKLEQPGAAAPAPAPGRVAPEQLEALRRARQTGAALPMAAPPRPRQVLPPGLPPGAVLMEPSRTEPVSQTPAAEATP